MSANSNSVASKYKYQSQELEESLGYNMHEFELRHYDAAIGRFVTNDPYEQFMSPYIAMGNNPVVSFDPDGGYCYDSNGNQITCPEGYEDFDIEGNDTNVEVLDEVVVEADLSDIAKQKEVDKFNKEVNELAVVLDKLKTLETGKTSSERNRVEPIIIGDLVALDPQSTLIGGGAMDLIGGKAAVTYVYKFSYKELMKLWTKSPRNLLSFDEAVKVLSKEYLDKYKRQLKVGTNAGRSGGHGTPWKKAGDALIREANKAGVDPQLAAKLKKEGKRLIEKGKGFNH